MIIYSIIVYTSSTKYFDTSMTDVVSNIIHEYLEAHNAYRLKNLMAKKGSTTLNIPGGVFYAHNTGDRVIVLAMDKDYKALQEKDPTVAFDYNKLIKKIIDATDADDLKTIMHIENYSGDKYRKKIDAINKDIDETKDIMAQDIEKLYQRGEKLEDLLGKTENIKQSAHEFADSTRRLANRYRWCGLFGYVEAIGDAIGGLFTKSEETVKVRHEPAREPQQITMKK